MTAAKQIPQITWRKQVLIRPIKNGVVGPELLVEKGPLTLFWESGFMTGLRVILQVIGLITIISWFM